jgi:cbb3-type cytochrome oxidase maturation protein
MSLSSLLVVVNALRLARKPRSLGGGDGSSSARFDAHQARRVKGLENRRMEILYLLVPLGTLAALGIGAAFWAAVAGGQFDDLDRRGSDILSEDEGT